jgi:rod shape-determining protein MreC
VLVAISLALLTGYFGESTGGALHAVQRGAQEALAPLEEGASRALKPFSDLFNWVGDVLSAKGDNDRLKEELEAARQQLAQAEADRREAAELRGLVGLAKQAGYPADVEPVTARVIGHSPIVWYASIQIDKGSSDGIRANQPVVTSGGLAGRVDSTTSGRAQVTLITDASSSVAAQVMPNGAQGIVRPQVSNPNDLLLDFIQKGRTVTKGAVVITSGLTSGRFESLFPRGIPIGKVDRVDATERELYQRVHVKPFADLRSMDFVQVLRRRGGGEQARVTTP